MTVPPTIRRRDVDGLRAVAILLVLVFHCFPAALPGGFVGVDIFFVISGYLITGRLISDVARGHFSVREFYARRARRLLPALIVVLLATAAAGFMILFEPERRALGRHLLSALRFGSNFTLMNESGYFDSASNLKPLLHLWSLAIEEQFYLVFPLVLWAAGARARAATLVFLALSVGTNVYLAAVRPDQVFYHPLARVWEPLAGSLLAFCGPAPRRARELLAHAGLALVALAAFVNGDHDAYPNLKTLPVIAGTLALIWADASTRVAGRLLRGRVANFIGAISYPLYLWHWPILAYARLELGDPLGVRAGAGVMLVSFGLATLTLWGLEKPFGRWSGGRQGALIVAGFGALLLTGRLFHRGLAGVHPLPESMALHRDFAGLIRAGCGLPGMPKELITFCLSDAREPATHVVWGDSKADALYPALVKRSRAGARWAILGRPSCPPLRGVRRTSFTIDDGAPCRAANDLILPRLVNDAQIRFVLLASADRILFDQRYAEADRPEREVPVTAGLTHAVEALIGAGKSVGFLLDNPTLQASNLCVKRPFEVLGPGRRPGCTQPIARYRERMRRSYALAADLKSRWPNIQIIDPTAPLCDESARSCSVTVRENALYSYFDHLSDFGAGRVVDQMLDQLAESSP